MSLRSILGKPIPCKICGTDYNDILCLQEEPQELFLCEKCYLSYVGQSIQNRGGTTRSRGGCSKMFYDNNLYICDVYDDDITYNGKRTIRFRIRWNMALFPLKKENITYYVPREFSLLEHIAKEIIKAQNLTAIADEEVRCLG